MPGTAELAALAEIRNPSSIARVEEDGGVRYSDVMLLAPGEWTDAGSGETVHYAGDAIRESADNWENYAINLMHGPALHDATVLGEIGKVPPDSIAVDDADRLFGDLVLHGDSPASELGIELMDEALESDGRQGIDGPSVEIVEDTTEYDPDRGRQRMTSMTFGGVGLVFDPASRDVDLANQIRERAVAMREHFDARPGAGVTIREYAPGAPDEDPDLVDEVEMLQSELDEARRTLQGATGDDREQAVATITSAAEILEGFFDRVAEIEQAIEARQQKLADLVDTLGALDRRLSRIEAEPLPPRSLTQPGDGDFYSEAEKHRKQNGERHDDVHL